ncbi:DUF4262 domain-containing protein [Streptomyces violascens]|uniref:DUF4262 domain-containing protein n=1 Tax=Streptomyces violascens TaxID=67381 RepID=UPI00364E39DD
MIESPHAAPHGVAAGDDSPGNWGYSIGPWPTQRSPEASVFGLPSQTAMRVANAAGAAIRDSNPLAPDQRPRDVLNNGYAVVVRPVHPSWYYDFFGAGIDCPWAEVAQEAAEGGLENRRGTSLSRFKSPTHRPR